MGRSDTVEIGVGEARLAADLELPDGAFGVVVFAHGSGSSRHSARNREVAARLRDAAIATLLLDLLTEQEEQADSRTRTLRFDIPMLARRTIAAVDWLAQHPATAALPVGTFGASTGAAAALIAAASRPERVHAVVSRGGRPDLAAADLGAVRAPVLLVVGGNDAPVRELNERAARSLARHEMHVVAGASHLFEEPGALEEVTRVATAWFGRWLGGIAAEDTTPFANREDAGRALAVRLRPRLAALGAEPDDVVALGLARGGVPVAAQVARAIGAPLDVLVVRKLGVPAQPELALGAIASGGVRVLNLDVVARAGASPHMVEEVTRAEAQELRRREERYRRGAPAVPLAGRTVVLIDDGLATGASMRVAVEAVRHAAPARVVVAVPVGPAQACRDLEGVADDVVCARTPRDFGAVGQFYDDFRPTRDDEVTALLARAR